MSGTTLADKPRSGRHPRSRARRLDALRVATDAGPRQRRQHDAIAIEPVPADDGAGMRARVSTQRPLDRYRQRGEISPEQHDAGERLRRDFEIAGLQPRVVMHYAPRLPRSAQEPDGNRLDARSRLFAAIDGVGRLGEGVLWHVACVGETAGDWAHRHGRAPRDGIVLLRAALDELDRFYRAGDPRRCGAADTVSDGRAAAARR